MLDKLEVARALREIGMLLEVKGENPFKVRAYERGARALEELQEELSVVVAPDRAGRLDRLTDLPGIGDALAKKIVELHQTGRLPLLDRLRAELPPGILELLQIPDLGARKIAALHAALGVASIPDLEAACLAGRVREVRGFGERSEQKILEGIRRLQSTEPRHLLSEALEMGERILAHLRRSPAVERAELAGSARRSRETVGDIDLVVASRDPTAVSTHFLEFLRIAEVIGQGETKTSVRLGGGMQADLRVVPPEDYATLLHHLTGSKAHHVRLRGLARDKGLTLSEWGLIELAGGKKLPIASEAELYQRLGMAWIPPELREDQGEIEAALAGTLPQDLIRLEDLQGMVHCHTRWSDGRATMEEMARAAEAMGMRYLTVTDHSATAAYAGGLDVDRLERQWEELARVQEKVAVRLLRGTEADILQDGSLDWPDAILERFDVIIASIHSRFSMDEEAMTQRLVRAMRQPVFKIWGHALGRILLERPPLACRMEEVLDAAAEGRAAIEISGDPRRLELEPRFARLASQRGIPFVISTDAHSPEGLANLRYGVGTARRGWVRRTEVLNSLPVEEFLRAVKPAR
jgi:DNA polymerase (family 10)